MVHLAKDVVAIAIDETETGNFMVYPVDATGACSGSTYTFKALEKAVQFVELMQKHLYAAPQMNRRYRRSMTQ